MTHKDLEEKKQLQRKQTKEWKQKNKERVSEYNKKYNKEYYQKNKEKIKKYFKQNKEKTKEYYQKNKEKIKDHYQRNKEKIIEKTKEYYKQNKGKISERDRNRFKADQNYRLKCLLRRRIRTALKGYRKNGKTLQLLGCTTEFLKQYLESKFQPGMTWENYGNPNGDHSDCWHIDHIKPCASFDLSDPRQQKECFHYTNLQPLWAIDNIKKGCK